METEPGLRGQDTDLQFLPLKNLSVGVEGKRGRGVERSGGGRLGAGGVERAAAGVNTWGIGAD